MRDQMARFKFGTAIALNLMVVINGLLIRKNVDNLGREEILSLQKALGEVIEDTSPKGYAAIAAYHGYPPQCQLGKRKVACCIHGSSVFPQWHRLLTVQLEQALTEKGLGYGIPYWDWTLPLTDLPKVAQDPLFLDTDGGSAKENHWFGGHIKIDGVDHSTARAVDSRLFQQVSAGSGSDLFWQVMNALEYHNYCQFEVQFEIAHNTIHYLVGGRHKYSLSHLEYTAYDPLFFLHHSNVDRIYCIYHALQQDRGYSPGPGCTGKCENCDVQRFDQPLEPFSRDTNPFPLTKVNAKAKVAHDTSVFGYRYDNLTLNGHDLNGIKQILKGLTSHDRAFAAFRLHGIGTSVDVRVKVCLPSLTARGEGSCELAGDFFILGGPLEMSWIFSRPFYFDITSTVLKLGLTLTDNYNVKADYYSVNGTKLRPDILPTPVVHYRPVEGKEDPPPYHDESGRKHELHAEISLRKDADRLTREEIYELRDALHKFQNDRSIAGYQALAEFHGDPGKCPYPTAKKRFACCIHGAPTFPHWHRLFVVQFEDGLRKRGSHTGVPYWDWSKPNTRIPALASEETYTDPYTNEKHLNPFYDAEIVFLNRSIRTTRDVSPDLSQTPVWGDHTDLFDAYLLALEQDDFCDFEIQFEFAHNLIHGLVGGSSPYGMSSLSYSGFDPIFFLHHSNVDRIWATWTALQVYRGKPYKAHCAQSLVYQPLKPFAFKYPFNSDKKTFGHSTPTNVYDYEKELGYTYDNLEFGGMSIPELDDYINTNLKGKPRTFAGMQLWGLGTSAQAEIYVSAPGGSKYKAGRFDILGGPNEMPWGLDRAYRHDITDALEAVGVQWFEPFDLTIEMHEYDGTPIDSSQFPKAQIIHKGKEERQASRKVDVHVRTNVDHLTETEALEVRQALASLQEDKSNNTFQDLGRYHGTPKWCPTPDAAVKKSCCVHGMPTFPHWHRLWTVQAENALRRHGYHGAIPYWDWTKPLVHLPDLVSASTYTDPSSNTTVSNPFYSAHIDDVNKDTVREVRHELFQQPAFGQYTDIAKQVLLAFEQDNFCDFEVQFEIAHNFIHALVGGSQTYSMASLMYTAFDPIFYLHHSNTDRLWAIWQALQKYRGKPYNSANCAIGQLRTPLSPFSLTSDVNPDPVTRENSMPFKVFDYQTNFHYEYDNLEFNGLTVPQLSRVLEQNKAEDRVFAGFMLHGIGRSALIKFYICVSASNCSNFAGEFYLLGDENEMKWTYDRLYTYDISDQLKSLSLRYDDRYYIRYEVLDLDGTVIGTDTFSTPNVLRKPGTGYLNDQELRLLVSKASSVRSNLHTLTESQKQSLRSALSTIKENKIFERIASYHGAPYLCKDNDKKVPCCIHGLPRFLAWHRLMTAKMATALLQYGSSVALPYWDWTVPFSEIPGFLNDATYFDTHEQKVVSNPFFSGQVAETEITTIRHPMSELFNNKDLYKTTYFALEQENFCDFQIQLEAVHNNVHNLIGGDAEFSMASIDYAAFDPIFYFHHCFIDRLWAVWQELQRRRGLPYNEPNCDINNMRTPLEPYHSDEVLGPDDFTKKYSRAIDTFDYRKHFDYEYDNLEFQNMNIPQLHAFLEKRKQKDRIFAEIPIRSLGLSTFVDIFACIPMGHKFETNCDHKVGNFSIFGGKIEMPWISDRPLKVDITSAVEQLGIGMARIRSSGLSLELRSDEGSEVPLTSSITFVPGTTTQQDQVGMTRPYLVRKDVNSLNTREKLSLIQALQRLQADSSADGYQSVAAFHAVPPLCPSPEASERYACCVHGEATFPPWHRLYTVQVEDGLRRHGALVGLPYLDWTSHIDALPNFLTEPTYTDPYTGVLYDNPFNKATIDFENSVVERDVLGEYLFKRGPNGWDTWLFKQMLFALEQEDYCDFEIQFEIAHNAIHSWVGGAKEHSMGHLHYASYDPFFFLHHSNADRIWAIWQELQKHRGHPPNEVNCALELMREPLKPFSFGSPYNLNPTTKDFSNPEDTFDYSDHFHYRYDELEFVGMNIPALDDFIKEKQEDDRVFAAFLITGIGSSAFVDFEICSRGQCFDAGYFTILGGSAEMPWKFDRSYKYEITDQLKEHNIRFDEEYEIKVRVKYPNGTQLASNPIPTPSVLLEPGKIHSTVSVPPNRVRSDLSKLGEREITSLKAALHDLQLDTSNDGWAHLASFHGAPVQCPDPDHPTVACCQHGMPTFPHWHRLFALQVEQALSRQGSSVALPYWDWTRTITELPDVFTQQTYYDVWKDEVFINPFSRGYVPSEKAYTVRDVQPELYQTTQDGRHSKLLYLVISALEQTDYCDFEVQFEVMHNAIHYLVGGHQTYSLSSLEYSAYDPIFFIHHSFTDKIWVVWQELQKRRHLSYNRADCAVNSMNVPMKPFSLESLNFNKFTRDHAVPNSVFDHEDLGYAYDNLEIGDYGLDELEELIAERQSRHRVFAGFLLKGIQTSASVVLSVCLGNQTCHYAGRFNLLGGPTEAPWSFNRLFKLDITWALKEYGLKAEGVLDADSQFRLDVQVYDVEGHVLSGNDVLPGPTIIFDPADDAPEATVTTTVAGVGVRKEVSTLSESEIENVRDALRKVQQDLSPSGFQNLASFHGEPATRCTYDGHPVACCIHGMANFPQWHRLYIKQWEDALTAKGARVGIPYWEWTILFDKLPKLVTEEKDNPFHHGTIYNGEITTRAPRDALFNDPEFGTESFFYRQILLAFEQTDYCNFEIQFEITHNAIHSWTGGQSPYGMSTLEYTAYDPLFLLHHSNVDRQFAIWQALQKFRGLPYNSANCAIQLLHQPMRPFSDDDNNNPITRAYSRGIDAFDYDRFNYQYDSLSFHGLTIYELNDLLEKRKLEERFFAEILLHSLGTGADIVLTLHDAHNNSVFAGTFALLGGPKEMPWQADRLFRYDVTQAFHTLNLRPDSQFHFQVQITAVNGTVLDDKLIRPPSVQYQPGLREHETKEAVRGLARRDVLIRKDVNDLSLAEAANLRDAMHKLQQDQGPNGYEAIAGFHGAPFVCPESGDDKFACCVHGMVVFPHWHRLLTVQFEQALKKHGSQGGVPYWDWTESVTSLPSFFGDNDSYNPFHDYTIRFAGKTTTRDIQPDLYNPYTIDGHNHLYHLALDVLEEDNYCDFEVHFEILHNEVHALIGGKGTYSMATLDYSAFDPFFMIHHSSIDRIWVIWQELQKLRKKPFNAASCAGHLLDEPLHPFNYPGINKNDFTRRNSLPNLIFHHDSLGYEYDKLELNGHDIKELSSIISHHRRQDRVFFAGLGHGHQASISSSFSLLNDKGEIFPAGKIYLLGSTKEMPWAYERIYTLDITDVARQAGVSPELPIKVHITLQTYSGVPITDITELEDYTLIIQKPAAVDYDILIIPLGRKMPLPPKIVVKKGTRVKFIPVSYNVSFPLEDLRSYTNLDRCSIPPFSYNSYALDVVHALKPGEYYFVSRSKELCEQKLRFQIKVEDE